MQDNYICAKVAYLSQVQHVDEPCRYEVSARVLYWPEPQLNPK